jgi:hypothetical protein
MMSEESLKYARVELTTSSLPESFHIRDGVSEPMGENMHLESAESGAPEADRSAERI